MRGFFPVVSQRRLPFFARKSEIMLSLFDWGNTKLPRSENKTGLPFAWVKISVLKKLRGIYFSAMRVARGCGSGGLYPSFAK